MSNYFDYIISLGNDCSISGSLRKLKFKEASYPFDWNITSINFIYECIINKFTNIHKIIDKCSISYTKLHYFNEIIFQHENSDITQREIIKKKYKIRGDRLHKLCLMNKSILFVRKGEKDTINDIEKIKNAFESIYPTLNFKILLINNIKNDNNTFDNIINYNIDYDSFLNINEKKYKANHRNNKKSYENIYNILSQFSSKKYDQPKHRDLF